MMRDGREHAPNSPEAETHGWVHIMPQRSCTRVRPMTGGFAEYDEGIG